MKKILFLVLISFFSVYGCSSSEDKAAEYYQKAITYFDQGEYAKASVELKNALKINPNYADAYYSLGLIQEKNKNWKGMHNNMLNAVKFNPQHTEAILALAKLFLLSGEVEKSKEKLNEALSIEADNVNAQILQAAIAYKEQDKSKALDLITKVLKNNPNNIDALQLYVSMALPEKQFKQIQQAIELVQRNEKNEKVLDLLTIQLNAVQGKQAEVVKSFYSLIYKEPENLSYRQALALYFLRMNEQNKAAQVLRESVQDNPDNTTAKLMLVNFLSQQDVKTAITELEKQIETSSDEDNKLKLALAELYQQQGKKEDALVLYNTILQSSEQEGEKILVKNSMTRLALSSQNVDEARTLINEVLAEEPNNSDALLYRALIKLSDKEYESAITDLRVVLRNKPTDEKTLELLAAAYALNKSEDLATETIVKILEINPLNIRAANQYAMLNLKEKKYSKVIEIMQPLEKNQKLDDMGYAILMNAFLANKNWDEAKNLLKQNTNEDSSAYKTYINALILQGEGKYDESIQSLSAMLVTDPQAALPLTALVNNYIQNNDQNGAINYLNDFIAKNPSSNDQAYTFLTKLYLANKQPEKAIETYRKLITLKPDVIANYRTLADIYNSQGQTENAISISQQALTQKPDAVVFRYYLAKAYEQLKQNEKAIEQYEIILKQDPTAEMAANNQASLLSYSGNPEDLEKAYQLAKQFENTSVPYYADTLGWIYYLNGNMEKAYALLQVAVKNKDDMAIYHYHLGKVYVELNEPDKAKEQFNTAIKLADEKGKFDGYEDAQILLKK